MVVSMHCTLMVLCSTSCKHERVKHFDEVNDGGIIDFLECALERFIETYVDVLWTKFKHIYNNCRKIFICGKPKLYGRPSPWFN